MSKVRFTLNVLAAVIITMTVSSMAHAQATRTWVSGVGDDVNPCSRTAPCKTWAGAISKTAAGGEINALDPGGFGALTITKAITVDGAGTNASTLAAGVSGFIINANGSNDAVTLRNLSINGATTGIIGVRILAARSVRIENVTIFKFRTTGGTNGRAISDERTTATSPNGKLLVQNTTVYDNGANAIVANLGAMNIVLNDVRVHDNGLSGVFIGLGSKASIRNSVITGNGNAGVQAADANTEVYISDTIVSHNTSHGLFVGGGASTVRLSNVTIGENGAGVTVSGGTVETYGNNNVRGNGSANTLPASVGQQ